MFYGVSSSYRVVAAASLILAIGACPAIAVDTATLTVSTLGPVSSSIIVSSPAGISCPGTCSAVFNDSTTITLTETAGSTVSFAGWIGGCRTNSSTCSFPFYSTQTVVAKYNPTLSLSLNGNGLGAVSDSTGIVVCNYAVGNPCSSGAVVMYPFAQGSTITLTEVAGGSSTFVGWSGYSGCAFASTCTVHMSVSRVIVSTFNSAGPFDLAVTAAGPGAGLITSSPSGISCSSACAASFSSGTPVTLTASTTSASSYFAGWANGGCSGTSTCVVVSSSARQGLYGNRSPVAFFYTR